MHAALFLEKQLFGLDSTHMTDHTPTFEQSYTEDVLHQTHTTKQLKEQSNSASLQLVRACQPYWNFYLYQ